VIPPGLCCRDDTLVQRQRVPLLSWYPSHPPRASGEPEPDLTEVKAMRVRSEHVTSNSQDFTPIVLAIKKSDANLLAKASSYGT
jgi:hypothetical protein